MTVLKRMLDKLRAMRGAKPGEALPEPPRDLLRRLREASAQIPDEGFDVRRRLMDTAPSGAARALADRVERPDASAPGLYRRLKDAPPSTFDPATDARRAQAIRDLMTVSRAPRPVTESGGVGTNLPAHLDEVRALFGRRGVHAERARLGGDVLVCRDATGESVNGHEPQGGERHDHDVDLLRYGHGDSLPVGTTEDGTGKRPRADEERPRADVLHPRADEGSGP